MVDIYAFCEFDSYLCHVFSDPCFFILCSRSLHGSKFDKGGQDEKYKSFNHRKDCCSTNSIDYLMVNIVSFENLKFIQEISR